MGTQQRLDDLLHPSYHMQWLDVVLLAAGMLCTTMVVGSVRALTPRYYNTLATMFTINNRWPVGSVVTSSDSRITDQSDSRTSTYPGLVRTPSFTCSGHFLYGLHLAIGLSPWIIIRANAPNFEDA